MNDKKKKITSKQVVAMVGVILLVLLYLITLFAALFDSSASGQLFMTSMLELISRWMAKTILF